MTEHELRRRFPNASASTIKRNQAGGAGYRPSAELQEQQAGHPGPEHRQDADTDQAENKAVDEPVHRPVRVSITWCLSDKRRRDCWGMGETIADCIVAAARRLLETYAAGGPERKDG